MAACVSTNVNCENFWYLLSLGMEDMLSLAYGAAGNMVLMIVTVTAVWLLIESELSLSLHKCIKFLPPLLILAVRRTWRVRGWKELLFSSGPRRRHCLPPSKINFDSNYNYHIVFRSPLKGVIQN